MKRKKRQLIAEFQAGTLLPSRVSTERLDGKLSDKFSYAARLYEQGKLHSLKSIELYLTHWLRWAKGISIDIASLNALDGILTILTPTAAQTQP